MDQYPRIQSRKKTPYPKNLLIVGLAIHIVSVLIGLGADRLSQGAVLSLYWGGMLKVLSGLIGLIGGIMIIIWVVQYYRYHREPPDPAPCPDCGILPPSTKDQFCRQCGAELAANASLES